ncbi:MAG: alpha/beta hydrolase-fold protein [Pseudomonadales bacterium]|mgnify:CR=1 FL=1|jgi:hypothetical protein|nr:alpha/beta hydrolase-fold protein [Kiritimatiellia bacterium]MDP6971604.1 alpha/beta hydrolase-fold protein [Pseudomonadales bacterium]
MALSIEPKSYTSQQHDQFEVTAEGLGRYVIDVSLPPGVTPGTTYPVILVTDGNLLFDIAQCVAHGRSQQLGSLLPPAILVGVGYPVDEGNASFYARRNYDFHDEWDMQDVLGQTLHGIFEGMKAAEGKTDLEMHAGGAPRFQQFLSDELLPALAEHYPIDLQGRHTLIGDSSGGHFVLRTLYDENSPFSRYVSISPGFGSANDSIKEREARFAANHDDLEVDLFLCSGAVEVDGDTVMGLCRFGSGITWVAEQFAIRNWTSANVHWEIMNEEDHASIAPRAISTGLRSVFLRRPGVHKAEIAEFMAQFYTS